MMSKRLVVSEISVNETSQAIKGSANFVNNISQAFGVADTEQSLHSHHEFSGFTDNINWMNSLLTLRTSTATKLNH